MNCTNVFFTSCLGLFGVGGWDMSSINIGKSKSQNPLLNFFLKIASRTIFRPYRTPFCIAVCDYKRLIPPKAFLRGYQKVKIGDAF